MKINIKIIFFSIFFSLNVLAENLNIQAKNVSLNIDGKTSVFTDEVVVVTGEKSIKSDYVKYNKDSGFLIIKGNIKAVDKKTILSPQIMLNIMKMKKFLKVKVIQK